MNILLHKAWADLWLFKTRTLLATISVAAGVFCVGTLFGLIDLLLDRMDAAHQASNPSQINLILRNHSQNELLKSVDAIPGVKGVDSLTPTTVRYLHPGQTEWSTATLIFRSETSSQKFDKTRLLSGSWPKENQVAIEHLSAQSTGLQNGDQIQVKTDNTVQTVIISGTVRHPFIKPPKFGGHVHFFTDSSNKQFFAVPANSFRQMLVQITPPYSIDKARQIAWKIRTFLNQHDRPVNVTLLQDPVKHWGRPFLAGINMVLQIMAVCSLFLASALILNTLSSHVVQQTQQIGIMKSLGAGNLCIANSYLLEILAIALAAIVLALPPSLAASYLSACRLLSLFNIPCEQFDFSAKAVHYMLLGGILVPLLAGIGPVSNGASMTAREAMNHSGTGTGFGNNRFDLWLGQISERFLPTLYAAALGNLFRSKGRMFLTQSVLILAGVMFLVLMSLIASVNLTLNNELARSRYDLKLELRGNQNETKIKELVKSVPALRELEFWQRQPMEIMQNNLGVRYQGSLGAELIALPSASAMYSPLIENGRWLDDSDAGQRVIVVNADTAKLNGIKVGDSVTLKIGRLTNDWKVIGLYRWLSASNFAIEPVYAPLTTLRRLTQQNTMPSFLLMDAAINDFSEEADFVRQIKQIFQENAIKINPFGTLAKRQQRQFLLNQFNPVLSTLLVLAMLIAAVGGIGLSGTLVIGVLHRVREIGVMQSIGAPATTIFRLFLMEGLLHGLITWILSVPLAYFAAEPMAKELGNILFGIQLDFVFAIWAPLYWLGMVLILAWFSCFWPARKAAKMTVRECLGH